VSPINPKVRTRNGEAVVEQQQSLGMSLTQTLKQQQNKVKKLLSPARSLPSWAPLVPARHPCTTSRPYETETGVISSYGEFVTERIMKKLKKRVAYIKQSDLFFISSGSAR